MIFNGIEKDYLVPLTGRRRSAWAPISRNLITVTGMPGAHLSHTDVQVRVITVPVLVKAENISDLQKTKEDMAEWLVHDEPKELILKDEPDRVYYAVVDGELELDEIFSTGRGEITFVCPDPYKYGPEKTVETTSDTFIVENSGTAEAEPIITMNVLQDTTFALVSNGEEYMMIGRPADALETPKNTRPLILNDPASTLVGWSAFTSGFDFYGMGIVGGSMKVHGGYAFTPETWGTNPNGWTGPAIRKSLSEPLQDFEVEIDIAMFNHSTGVGTIRVVGLDANDKPVFSMGMADPTNSYPNNRAIYGLGENNKIWFTYQGDRGQKVWNNGRFLLRISRKGKEFSARIARKLDPQGYEQTGRHTRTYTDTRNEYQNPITQIAVYIARARNFANFEMLFHHLAVRKLINPADYEVPLIAQAGDEIVFDHKTAECYVNGDPVPFDFGADFFTLKKGVNNLTVLPENTFDTKVTFRDKYL